MDRLPGPFRGNVALTGAAALLLVVVVGFAVMSLLGGGSNTIKGAVDLVGTANHTGTSRNGTPCQGLSGYDDMAAGTEVVVKNGEGKIVGSSRLSDGIVAGGDDERCVASCSEFSSCHFAFEVEVPNEDFYSIEVSSRGELTYSKEELTDKNWGVEFSLGP